MKAEEVFFEEAQGEDATYLAQFFNQAEQESEFIILDGSLFVSRIEDLGSQLEQMEVSDHQLCLLAKIGKRVIGVITVVSESHSRLRHVGDIFLLVAKDYWKKGIGSILLEETIWWARESGIIHRLELTVFTENVVAVHLYRKFGFGIEGIKRRAARSKDGVLQDVYMMAKLLEEGNR